MKKYLTLVVLAALGGCVVAPPGPANYGTRAQARSSDPSQWRVVSVTPVAPGTGARVAAESGGKPNVEYSSVPSVAYQPVPVYVEPQAEYYYPPVSLSLGFVFGRHWGWGGRGHFRGHGRRR